MSPAGNTSCNDAVRQTLVGIVGRFGRGLSSDPRRCNGLLRDFCPQHRRETNALLIAVREGIAADLLHSSTGTPKELLLSRLTKRLCDQVGLVEDLARWAVESWAMALGVTGAETSSKSSLPAAQPPKQTDVQAADSLPSAPRSIDRMLARSFGNDLLLRNVFLVGIIGSLMAMGVGLGVIVFRPRTTDQQMRALKALTHDLGNGVKLEMVLIPAGEFVMGDDSGKSYTSPARKVNISRPFYLGAHEVTQEQWEAVMGDNPSNFKGPKNPVEQVSWDDCQEFLAKLNAKFPSDRGEFILPTEAQWEYACRAGSTGKFCFGNAEDQLGAYAWYKANSDGTTHPTATRLPNAPGLHDMHGNVWEWCADWRNGASYVQPSTDAPPMPAGASGRVCRGGSWSYDAWGCWSASRLVRSPEIRSSAMGLRVAIVPTDK